MDTNRPNQFSALSLCIYVFLILGEFIGYIMYLVGPV